MSEWFPETVMIMAAGLGTRMRPLTDKLPKPLVEVQGKPIIGHVLDRLVSCGVQQAVINVHHLPHLMRDYAAGRTDIDIIISDESDGLLDSGGGIFHARQYLGTGPVVVINADSFWLDRRADPLKPFIEAYDPRSNDVFMLLLPCPNVVGYEGVGDFYMSSDNRLEWRGDRQTAPYFFPGIQVLGSDFFERAEEFRHGELAFKVYPYWNSAMKAGRMSGLVSDEPWVNVETIAVRDRINAMDASLFI